jgi:hypothetical protein
MSQTKINDMIGIARFHPRPNAKPEDCRHKHPLKPRMSHSRELRTGKKPNFSLLLLVLVSLLARMSMIVRSRGTSVLVLLVNVFMVMVMPIVMTMFVVTVLCVMSVNVRMVSVRVLVRVLDLLFRHFTSILLIF